jgi:hypothetical protein
MYAMVRMLKEFMLKIFGGDIYVETDCLPVIAMINNPDVIDATLLRWTAYIRLFNPIFVHIKGKDQLVSDALSRKVPTEEERKRDWKKVEASVEEAVDYEIKSVDMDECPEKYRMIIQYLSSLKRPDGVTDDMFKKIRQWSYKYFLKNDRMWMRKGRDRMPVRIIWKRKEIDSILQQIHDYNGHRGVEATFNKVKERFYWKDYYKDVKATSRVANYVNGCLQNAMKKN